MNNFISSLVAIFLFFISFSSIAETVEEEAARRLTPVLLSLDFPETLVSGQPVTIRWSILGYHEDYKSRIALFDCSIYENCGAFFSENFHASQGLSPVSEEVGEWKYKKVLRYFKWAN